MGNFQICTSTHTSVINDQWQKLKENIEPYYTITQKIRSNLVNSDSYSFGNSCFGNRIVVLALAGLVAGLIWVANAIVSSITKFVPFWVSVWTTVRDFFIGIWTAVRDFFVGILDFNCTFFIGIWNAIWNFIQPFVYSIYEIFRVIFWAIAWVINKPMHLPMSSLCLFGMLYMTTYNLNYKRCMISLYIYGISYQVRYLELGSGLKML